MLWGYSLSVDAFCNLSASDTNKLKTLLSSTIAYDSDKLSCIVTSDGAFSLFNISSVSGKTYSKIYFNSTKFSSLNKEKQDIILSNFESAINKSSISVQGVQLLYSEIRQYTDFDTKMTQEMVTDVVQPDIFSGYMFLKPFSSTISTIMGIVCVVIVFSLVASTVMDLTYICFPVLRDRMDEVASQRKNGAKRPWFISHDAISACRETDTSSKYKNALVIYFKHRVLTYIVLALCFTYLIGGLIFDLVQWLLTAFSQAFGM